jgi:chemotaxis protein CheX
VSSFVSQGVNYAVKPEANWKAVLECAAMEVFSMMAGAELTRFTDEPGQPHGEQTAMVGMAGALCGMLTIRCTSATAEKLAGMMLSGEAALNPSVIGDAMGELCNMYAGNFKSKISTLADHCMLSVPTVIWGEDYFMQTVQPNAGFQFALSFEGEPVWFSLVIHA